jgi:signal transduction histidine kinase
MPGGGGLLIVTSKNHAANDATLPGQIAGRNCVCIAVCDTGRGMSESVLARALEPFFDESEGNWTGLGLSIIAGFARKSGGTVRIRSSLGLGTVVEIFLPKAVETEPTA